MENQSNNIPQWKVKFPEAKHDPDPNCKKCNGVGYYYKPTVDLGDFVIEGHDTPCICIFITHTWVEECSDILKTVSSKIIKELDDNNLDENSITVMVIQVI